MNMSLTAILSTVYDIDVCSRLIKNIIIIIAPNNIEQTQGCTWLSLLNILGKLSL